MPQGGSVTLLSLLPIAVITYLYGTKRGVTAGVALGLVNLIFGPYVIHPVQLLLDYPIAFGALGLGGALRLSLIHISSFLSLVVPGRVELPTSTLSV